MPSLSCCHQTAWSRRIPPIPLGLLSSEIGNTDKSCITSTRRASSASSAATDVNDPVQVHGGRRPPASLRLARSRTSRGAIESSSPGGGRAVPPWSTLRRIDLRLCNKRSRALIDAGACDSLGGHRASSWRLDSAFGEARRGRRAERGQVACSDTPDPHPHPRPEVAPWSSTTAWRRKSGAGFFISGTPRAIPRGVDFSDAHDATSASGPTSECGSPRL